MGSKGTIEVSDDQITWVDTGQPAPTVPQFTEPVESADCWKWYSPDGQIEVRYEVNGRRVPEEIYAAAVYKLTGRHLPLNHLAAIPDVNEGMGARIIKRTALGYVMDLKPIYLWKGAKKE